MTDSSENDGPPPDKKVMKVTQDTKEIRDKFGSSINRESDTGTTKTNEKKSKSENNS